jgi:hypothetical protein
MQLSISRIKMMPNYQENVSGNQIVDEKLAIFPNIYQNRLLRNATKLLCLIIYVRRYANFFTS